jgi:hypothetical protein
MSVGARRRAHSAMAAMWSHDGGHLLKHTGHQWKSHMHPLRNHGRSVALLYEKHMQMGEPLHCMCWSSGRQARGRNSLEHRESCTELRCPLPPRWSPWSASRRAVHRLWDVPTSKCLLRAPGPRGLPIGMLGSNSSSAGAPKDEYYCHVAKHRGGAFSPAASSLSSHVVEVDVGAPACAPEDYETTVLVDDVPV